ncbi:hypothetical protein BGZ57DRAFT_989469 [Hyaloscypha finlandica]|nr:hypothetical protein BGZ57DRAFT_989469 [Hyaloscypha finlandica]
MLPPANREHEILYSSATGRAQSNLRAWAEGQGARAAGADAAAGRKPVDDDGSHPTLLHLKRRNRSDEPMTAGRAGHSLRSRFDFSWAARPCYSLYLRTGLDWTGLLHPFAGQKPRLARDPTRAAGVVWSTQIGPINWGPGRIAAVPFSSGARLDLSRPSATATRNTCRPAMLLRHTGAKLGARVFIRSINFWIIVERRGQASKSFANACGTVAADRRPPTLAQRRTAAQAIDPPGQDRVGWPGSRKTFTCFRLQLELHPVLDPCPRPTVNRLRPLPLTTAPSL